MAPSGAAQRTDEPIDGEDAPRFELVAHPDRPITQTPSLWTRKRPKAADFPGLFFLAYQASSLPRQHSVAQTR